MCESSEVWTFCKVVIPYISVTVFPRHRCGGIWGSPVISQVPPPYRLWLIGYSCKVSLQRPG